MLKVYQLGFIRRWQLWNVRSGMGIRFPPGTVTTVILLITTLPAMQVWNGLKEVVRRPCSVPDYGWQVVSQGNRVETGKKKYERLLQNTQWSLFPVQLTEKVVISMKFIE